MIIRPGTALGPYEVVAPLDAGGMGSVFRGRDPRLGREVAIKVLPVASMKDERRVKRFLREARAAAAVTHPNIVAIYDVGEAEVDLAAPVGAERVALRFLVEEFVEGPSLRRLLRSGRPPLGRLVEIATGIARGLGAAHEKGLIHRDLKPENVLLDARGTAKIADFGLVRFIYPDTAAPGDEAEKDDVTETLTRSGFVVGTLGYMSPEQVRGDPLGPSSDLFALGIVLYEMLAGETPFSRSAFGDPFTAILKEPTPRVLERIPGTPPRLAHVIERCLEKDAARRYPSAARVLVHLEELPLGAEGLQELAEVTHPASRLPGPPPAPRGTPARPRRRRRGSGARPRGRGGRPSGTGPRAARRTRRCAPRGRTGRRRWRRAGRRWPGRPGSPAPARATPRGGPRRGPRPPGRGARGEGRGRAGS
ncbi:serine/threonine protein kinase [Acidobacteria bacterium ACD]|nr:serine/threonine protein kinase [Acidobacteria bacterium ACD]